MKNDYFSPLIGAKYDQERTLRLMKDYLTAVVGANISCIEKSMVMQTLQFDDNIQNSVVVRRSDRDSSILYKAIKSRARWLAEE